MSTEPQQDRPPSDGRAPSPSALSTASSNSPLVRNGSSSSSVSSSSSSASSSLRSPKRPAPTSIAAAQLQCQQQQLEFMSNQQQQQQQPKKAPNGNKLAKMGAPISGPASQQTQHHHHYQPQKPQMTSNNNNNNKCQQQPPNKKKLEANGKSFSYNVAKSLAFRANRFNEFWSINKMRYMNLACLLMTIVCLITILVFSSFDKNSAPGNSRQAQESHLDGHHHHSHHRRNGHQLANTGGSLGHLPESIDSIDRQPLERPQQPAQPVQRDDLAPTTAETISEASENSDDMNDDLPAATSESIVAKLDTQDPTTDGFSLFDGRHHHRNHESEASTTTSTAPGKTGGQREVEDQTRAPAGEWPLAFGGMRRPGTPTGSLIDPILSQMFQDFERFNPFKALRDNSNNSKVSYTTMKPIVKHTKDGTTIIIRSGGFLNAAGATNQTSTTSNDSIASISSLIEKLLPPMLRPLSLLGSSNSMQRQPAETSRNGNGGIATITFNSEPIMASSSSSLSSMAGNPFRLPFHEAMSSPFSGFPRPLAFVSSGPPPAGGLFPAPPAPPGGGGLLSMIVRATEMANEANLLEAANNNKSAKGANNSNSSDNLITPQASQVNNQTVSLNGTTAADSVNSTSKSVVEGTELDAGDVETFDVSPQGPFKGQQQQQVFGSRRGPAGGSMIVISSSSSMVPSFASMFGGGGGGNPLFSPPSMFAGGPPQMFMMGGGGQGDEVPAMGMSPILRSILSNVMSDMDDKSTRLKSGANRRSMWTAQANNNHLNEEESPSSVDAGGWDEREPRGVGGRLFRGRHRSLAGDQQQQHHHPLAMMSTMEDRSSDLVNDNGESESPLDQLLDQSPMMGAFAGSIRQAFRGPQDVTFERMFALPGSNSGANNHQNRPSSSSSNPLEGVRSQSISRMDEPAAESLARPIFASRQLPPPSPMMNHNQRFGRFMQDGAHMLMPASPPVGLIDRLLGDLTGANGRLNQHQLRSRQDVRDDDDDLDEGDSATASADQSAPGWAPKWSPRIRVASARLRMIHPSASRRADSQPSALFMAPPRLAFAASSPEQSPSGGSLGDLFDGSSQPAASDQPASQQATIYKSPFEEAIEASMNEGQQQQQQQFKQEPSQVAAATAAADHSSPFTSPSSPLFGFPALPAATSQAPSIPNETKQPPQSTPVKPAASQSEQDNDNNNNNSPANHRRQRAFVYHSNHEIAGTGHVSQTKSRSSGDHEEDDNNNDSQRQVAAAATPVGLMGRPRAFMTPQRVSGLPPPASIIMGRRLDDGPFASAAAAAASQQDSLMD